MSELKASIIVFLSKVLEKIDPLCKQNFSNLTNYLESFDMNNNFRKVQLNFSEFEKNLLSHDNFNDKVKYFLNILNYYQMNVKSYYEQIKNNQFILNQLLELANNLSKEISGNTAINFFN